MLKQHLLNLLIDLLKQNLLSLAEFAKATFVTFGCDPVTKWYNFMFQVMIQIIGFTINIAKEMLINFAAVNEK